LRELLNARGEGDLMPSPEQLAAARTAGSTDGGYGASSGAYPGSSSDAGGGASSYTPYTYDSGSAGDVAASSGPLLPDRPETTPYTYSEPSYSTDTASSSSTYSSYSSHDASTGSTDVATGSESNSYPDPYSSSPSVDYTSSSSSSSFPGDVAPPEIAYNPAPTFPSASQEAIEYYCSNCKQSVPAHINDKCPHCGIRFDYVEQPDGSRKYNGRLWGGGIGGVIAVIIGIVIRMIVYAQRNA
jgi:hypothetical protein